MYYYKNKNIIQKYSKMIKNIVKDNILVFSILLFLIFFGIITYIKPSIFFNNDGSIRNFGLNNNKKTIIPIWLLTICLSIISYILIKYYVIIM